MSKLKVSFYIKNDKKKNKESAIYAKINLGSSTTTMFTGKYICPMRWRKTNMLQNANRINHEVSLKNYIYDIPIRIMDIYFKISHEGHNPITAIDLKNSYLGKTGNNIWSWYCYRRCTKL
jgi:hypothetical protein